MDNNYRYIEEAKKYITDGVNSPLRGFGDVDSAQICIDYAEGEFVYDVNKKRYIDFLLGFGPNILGHAPEEIVVAVSEQIQKGTVYAVTNTWEIELAKLIVDSTPCIEQIRMVNSGTEAVMSAVRLAKGYTGREKILKFDGSYHGHADSVLGVGNTGSEERYPLKGLDKSIQDNTIVARYNDLNDVKSKFKKEGNEIACIIIEPYACNMGLVMPDLDFLKGLRTLCDLYNTLLIFDEVMVGFRMTYGSVCNELGVTPDIITFGKVIGGGLPIGAYGAKEEIMRLVKNEEQSVYQSGTFAGNALSMIAGVAMLNQLKDGKVYAQLEDLGSFLERRVREEFKKKNIQYLFVRKHSIFSLFLVEDRKVIKSYNDVATQDFELFGRIHLLMLEEGFLLPPSADEVMHLCVKHTKEELDRFAIALSRSIIEAKEILKR